MTGQAVVLLGTGWLVADVGTGSVGPALLGAVACAVASAAMTLPWPRALTLPLSAIAASLVTGAVAGLLVDLPVDVLEGLAIGLAAGGTTGGLHVLLHRQPTTSHRRAAIAAGAACVVAAGLAVHVGARLTLG